MPETGANRSTWRLWVSIVFAFIAFGVFGISLELLVLFPARQASGSGKIIEIEVPTGVGPKGLASLLHKEGVVSNPLEFELWLRAERKMPSIKAGRFRVADILNADQLAVLLSGQGIPDEIKVVIPEGFTLTRICELLEKNEIVGCDEFIKAATDPKLLSSLGIPGPTAEGYLFPDTYLMSKPKKADRIITDMFRNFESRASPLGLPSGEALNRLVTLASIVQAEAKALDEMPTIAGVYANRLDKSKFRSQMLQADPTVTYGCEPFVTPKAPSCKDLQDALTRAQLDDPENPYNTYRHSGLPPGPICAPGLDALKAAHEPADVPYLYFVADNNGRHVFSSSLRKHNRAVERYRKARESQATND